ncbi:hypothetical protein AB0878_45925 [Amycolatopsis sp. NPDC047767]|uniref:hypothetical protein n=1 Tax=Amycolatopsis sp. NPDC047767 TaxID=3156765 RepID=UPI003452094C
MTEADYRRRDLERRAEMLTLPTVRLRHHAKILAPQEGDVRVTASIGPSGEAVALWSTPEDLAALRSTTTQPGWATFPDAVAPHAVAARVSVHAPEPIGTTRIARLPVAHPHVQPLPDGRTLIVGARCRWREGGPDRNAIVFDADGTPVIEQTLGDGIEHVAATRRGEIWAGYFDEGVFGNYGWGGENADEPLGDHGLNRFSADLTLTWRFRPPDDHGSWGISDCYALNVDGDTAWTCHYTDFPVVRIRDGEVTGWHNDVHGARALAVGGSRVVFYGGYGAERDRLVVGVLGDDRVHVTGEYRLVRPDGRELPAVRAIGRGPDLHVLLEHDWLRLSVEDLPGEEPR